MDRPEGIHGVGASEVISQFCFDSPQLDLMWKVPKMYAPHISPRHLQPLRIAYVVQARVGF